MHALPAQSASAPRVGWLTASPNKPAAIDDTINWITAGMPEAEGVMALRHKLDSFIACADGMHGGACGSVTKKLPMVTAQTAATPVLTL